MKPVLLLHCSLMGQTRCVAVNASFCQCGFRQALDLTPTCQASQDDRRLSAAPCPSPLSSCEHCAARQCCSRFTAWLCRWHFRPCWKFMTKRES